MAEHRPDDERSGWHLFNTVMTKATIAVLTGGFAMKGMPNGSKQTDCASRRY